MNYGLIDGDVVLCKRNVTDIHRGDMIVVEQPDDDESRLYVKRCAALPGDRFFEKDRHFYLQIDGDSEKTYQLGITKDLDLVSSDKEYFIKDPYLKYYSVVHNRNLSVPPPLSHYPLGRVMPGHYFILGDYRDNSADSRFFGAIPKTWIRSKVIFVFKKPRSWMELVNTREID